METRAKLPKKVLSLFLSVLMALSCVAVALPTLAPKAKAEGVAATPDQWQALAGALSAAYSGGYLSNGDFANYNDDDPTKLVLTDETENGYFYAVFKALAAIAAAEGTNAGHDHNKTLLAYIEQTLYDMGLTLNATSTPSVLTQYQRNFLKLILDPGAEDDHGYGQYCDPDHPWTGYEADAPTANKQIKVEATRTVLAALLTDYENISDIGDTAETKTTLTIVATPTECAPGEPGDDFVGRYYKNTSVTTSSETSATSGVASLADLKAYAAYVAADPFKTNFNKWYRNGATYDSVVYSMDADILSDVVENLLTSGLLINANLADTDLKERFVGLDNMARHADFVGLCDNVLQSSQYIGAVRWIVEGTPLSGYVSRDSYSGSNPESINAVKTDANRLLDIVKVAPAAAQEALKELFDDYRYVSETDNSFVDFINMLDARLNLFYLEEIAQAANVILKNGAGTTYTFQNAHSEFYPITYGADGEGVLWTYYVKTSDSEIDQTKTYYTMDGSYRYALTADTAPAANKTYYTYSEDDGYVAVETPNADDIGTYYERTGFIPACVATTDTEPLAGKTYYVKGEYAKVASPVEANLTDYYVIEGSLFVAATEFDEDGTYFTLVDPNGYTAVAAPLASHMDRYYEATFTEVTGPVRSNLGSYYELKEAIYGLKGVGDNEYLSDNYQGVSYVKTEDTAIDSGKTYYTSDGTVVQNPVAAELGNYYDRVVTVMSECPISNADLEKLIAFFALADAKITTAEIYEETHPAQDDDPNAFRVKDHIGLDMVAEIRAMKTALEEEYAYRSLANESFISDYEYFAKRIGSYSPSAKSVSQLRDEIAKAEAALTQMNTHNGFSTSAKGKLAQEFVDSLYLELYTRANAQVQALLTDCDGSIPGLSTYYLVKAEVDNLDQELLLYLSQTSYYTYTPTETGVTRTTVPGVSSKLSQVLERANQKDGGTRSIDDVKLSVVQSRINLFYEYVTTADTEVDHDKLYYSGNNRDAVVLNPTAANLATYKEYKAKANPFTNIYGTISSAQRRQDDIERRYMSGSDIVRTSTETFTADFTNPNNNNTPDGNSATVSGTISNIDNFLAHREFVTLIGADERADDIDTLTEYLQDVLAKEVFSDKMVNTIVSMLFPLLTNLFEETVPSLLDDFQGASLSELSGGEASGTLYIYLNGSTYVQGAPASANSEAATSAKLTNTFESITKNVFSMYIYPSSFSEYIRPLRNGAYSSIATAIARAVQNGKSSWDYFKDPATDKITFDFDWGIDNVALNGRTPVEAKKDQFIQVMSDVFGAATNILRTLFGNNALNLTVNGKKSDGQALAYGYIYKLKYSVLSFDAADVTTITARLQILSGLNLYRNLWIPLMEALGMNAGVFDWTNTSETDGKGVQYYRNNIQGNFSIEDLVKGLINPLYKLIITLTEKPVETVLKLLPNLSYHIMNDSLSKLLDVSISLDVQLAATGINGDGAELSLPESGVVVNWLISLFNGTIVGRLRDKLHFAPVIELGSMLNLSNLLGFDITDLNAVLRGVIGMIKSDAEVNLPPINTYTLATCFTRIGKSGTDNWVTTYRGDGNPRVFVEADTEQVLYVIIDWLVRNVKKDGMLSGILGTIASLTGSDIDLPEIVFTIVKNLGGSGARPGAQVFAALVELLNAQTYSMRNIDWYNKEGAENVGTLGLSAAQFVYTNYNDWTTDKADYLYENIDSIVDAIFNMIDSGLLAEYDGKASNWLNATVNSMFNNWGITNVIDLVMKLGGALAESTGLVKFLQNAISSSAGTAFNLYDWFYTYGHLYPEYCKAPDASKNEFVAYNTVDRQTYVYQLKATDDEVEIDMSDPDTYTFDTVRAYPVAPDEVVLYKMTRGVRTPAESNFKPYVNRFPNITFTTRPNAKGTAEDPKYIYTVKLDENTAALWTDFGSSYTVGTQVTLTDGSDTARAAFTTLFCELIGPFAPIFALILNGDDLNFFGGNLKIKGYESYNGAILPLMEALGVYNLMSQEEFEDAYSSNIKGGFNYLVKKLFDAVSDLLTGENAFQKVIDILPHLFYLLQSDGISAVLRNVGMFAWQLLDTIRPIVNLNVDDLLHLLLTRLLGYVYDPAYTEGSRKPFETNEVTTALVDLFMPAPTYTSYAAERDLDKVKAVFGLHLKSLKLENIYAFVAALTGLDLEPLSYAFEGMCIKVMDGDTQVSGVIRLLNGNGVAETEPFVYSAFKDPTKDTPTYEAYTLKYLGRDVITVILCVALDFLRYDGCKNAARLDELLGTVRETVPGAQALISDKASAQGLMIALEAIFADSPYDTNVQRPNWDYIFEGKYIPNKTDGAVSRWVDITNNDYTSFAEAFNGNANLDLHELHRSTMTNLEYVTDWKPETSDATLGILNNIFTYINSFVSMSTIISKLGLAEDTDIDSVGDLLTAILEQKVFTTDSIVAIVNLLAQIYDILPVEIRNLINTIIDINMNAWSTEGIVVYGYPYATDDKGNLLKDADGNYTKALNTDKPKSNRVNLDYKWFDPDDGAFVNDQASFLAALKEIISPAANLFSFIFLSKEYRLLKSFGDDIQHPTDNDAIVINGASAYANAIVPLLEALGVKLTGREDGKDYSPASYKTTTYDSNNNPVYTYNSEQFINDMFDVFTELFETIEEDPLAWLFDNLPNLIYFVNAGGITTSIQNVFGSVNAVLEAINTFLPSDSALNITDFLGSGVNLTKLDLRGVFDLIYTFTCAKSETGDDLPGMYFRQDLCDYVKGLYVGDISSFTSANGYISFRMDYSTKEDESDMVTIILALLLEYLTDKGTFTDDDGNEVTYDNTKAFDRLLQGDDYVDGEEGQVGKILSAISDPQSLTRIDVDWDYFDESLNLAENTDVSAVIMPAYAFQYLNYTTAWKRNNAESLSTGLDSLIINILKQLPASTFSGQNGAATYEKIQNATKVGDLISLDTIYTSSLLQGILDGIANLLYPTSGTPFLSADLIGVIGGLIGINPGEWNHKYAFVDAAPEGVTLSEESLDGTNKLKYYTEDEVRMYVINDQASFVAGLVKLLMPAKTILSWILFGDDFEFFSGNTDIDKVLVKIKGSNGYKDGLALLLEALGCENLESADVYKSNPALFISDLANSLSARLSDIAEDPINEIAELIPELIYFINAGGLQASITGLLAGPLGLITQIDALEDMLLNALHISDDETDSAYAVTADSTPVEKDYNKLSQMVNSLLNGVLNESLADLLEKQGKESFNINFHLEGVNLKYIFEVAEEITGLEITDVAGNKLDKFVLGKIKAYASRSETIAYKAEFRTDNQQDFADLITIVLSLVVDTITWKADNYKNYETFMTLLGLDENTRAIADTIMDLLKDGFEASTMPIDWFYFDPDYALYEESYVDDELVITRTDKDQIEISEASSITVPENTINYLTYASDWTDETATYLSENLGAILDAAIQMMPIDGVTYTSLSALIAEKVNLNELYSADTLNTLLEKLVPLAGNQLLQGIVGDLIKIILDIDLSGYADMDAFEEFTSDTIAGKRAEFINGLTSLLEPLSPILDWILFGKSLSYFDKKDYTDGTIEEIIKLDGSYGYEYGLVPVLEALGVVLPAVSENDSTETMLGIILNNTLARLEVILNNPVDEVLAILPNVIYFINTNALAACVHNLLDAVFTLLNKLSPMIFNGQPAEDEYNVQTIVNNLLTYVLSDVDLPDIVNTILTNVNFQKLDLMAIIELVEKMTGMEIAEVLADDADNTGKKRIENFYLKDIVYNENSASRSFASFKMLPSNDTLTVIVNFLIEVVLYSDNASKIDALITGDEGTNKHIVEKVVELILGIRDIESTYTPIDWNYFDHNVVLENTITVPANKFLYLDYVNSWTFDKAVYIDEKLNEIVAQILAMIPSIDAVNVSDLLKGLINLDEFLNAETLNTILNTITGLLSGDDENAIPQVLMNAIGYLIDADLTQWDGSYTFEDKADTYTYSEADAQHLLPYRIEDDVTVYAIADKTDFGKGLRIMLEPAEGLLGWLLLGDTYGFFVSAADGNVDAQNHRLDNELIRVPGSDGYNTGLVLLLEALGIETQPASAYSSTAALLDDVITGLLNRIDEILNDPIDEVLNLIPELIYFINAGGLNAVLRNVAGSILSILDEVRDSGLLTEEQASKLPDVMGIINGFIEEKLGIDNFDFATVNLDWVIGLIEAATGLKISPVLGRAMRDFAIGIVTRYDSATRSPHLLDGTTTLTYKMTYDTVTNIVDGKPVTEYGRQARADMITIVLSLAIDVLDYKWTEDGEEKSNAAVVEALINKESQVVAPGTIASVLEILHGATVEGLQTIDWFYMDGFQAYDADDNEIETTEIDQDSKLTVTHTINYLTYASDWTPEAADYVVNNFQGILSDVLAVMNREDTTVAELIKGFFDPATQLYTADNLNAIAELVGGLVTDDYEAILNLVGLIIDVNLSAYSDMSFTIADVYDRDSFIDGLVEVLEPIRGLLNWLLFGEDFKFFYDNDIFNAVDGAAIGEGAHHLINLAGNEGYRYGLAPILEALGVELPALPEEGKLTEENGYLEAVLTAVFTRLDEILADPVTKVLEILPNVLYFINANGLSVSVHNLLRSVTGLIEKITPVLSNAGILPIQIKDKDTGEVKYTISELSVNAVLNALIDNENITIDIDELRLLDIVEILEAAFGLKIAPVVTENKIENFYLGKLEYNEDSVNEPAFKMVYSDDEGEPEMITVLVNFVIEVLLYEDADGSNLDAILALIKAEEGEDPTELNEIKQKVKDVIALLTGNPITPDYAEPNWNYFDGDTVINDADQVVAIRVPKDKFLYLAYQNDWTYARAENVNDNLNALVDEVLALIPINGKTYTSLAELIDDLVDLDGLVFNADTLNSILGLVSGFLYGEDAPVGETLLEFAGILLGAELTQWKDTYAFETYDENKTYTVNAAYGLKYRTAEDGKIMYAVSSKEEFVNALVLIFTPAQKLLSWLLLGDSYGFFVPNADGNVDIMGNRLDKELLRIPGALGYNNGLALLLEALGVEGLEATYADGSQMLKAVLSGLVARVDEILADPLNEILALIPEIIYFINANGLGAVVNNVAGFAFKLLNAVGMEYNVSTVNDLLNNLLNTFLATYGLEIPEADRLDLTAVDLDWVVRIVEDLTDIEIKAVFENEDVFKTFAIGEAVLYDSVSTFETTYRMQYADGVNGADRADLITLVLSFALDLIKSSDHNQALLEDELDLTAGTIGLIIDLLSGTVSDIDAEINWFYFTESGTYNYTEGEDLTRFIPSIGYLSYASNWDERLADYVDNNLEEFITEIFAMIPALADEGITNVAQLVARYFNLTSYYNADTLNNLAETLRNFVDDILGDNKAIISEALDLVIDINVAAWDEMTFGAEINSRATFANGLAQVLEPLYPVLDWLLFGDDIAYFNKKTDDTGIEDMIVVKGYEGYANGLVPILEALGVQLPDVSDYEIGDERYCTAALLPAVVNAVLERAEDILNDPVEQVLAILPNVLYFINANGVSASVKHLLGAVLQLTDAVNPLIRSFTEGEGFEVGGVTITEIDVNTIVNNLLEKYEINTEIDIDSLRLLDIVTIVENLTGLTLVDIVTADKLEKFYLGQIEYAESSTGAPAFRMVYSEDAYKDRADMLTVVLNFVLEALYGDDYRETNVPVIENLLNLEPGTIEGILELLDELGKEPIPGDYDWNYYGGEVSEDGATISTRTTNNKFNNYLTYESDWTRETANTLYQNLSEVVDNVIALINKDDPDAASTLAELINGSFTLYKAEYVNKILELTQNLYGMLDDKMIEVLGLVLDVDLTVWDGLVFEDSEIIDAYTFRKALVTVLEPISSVLDWLLFGKSYAFFVEDQHPTTTLINIAGNFGYAYGLVPALEALGVDLPDYKVGRDTCSTLVTVGDEEMTFLEAVLKAVFDRVDEILADPVDQALALLPELLYFINANGLSTAVYNLIGGLENAADVLLQRGLITLKYKNEDNNEVVAENLEEYVLGSFGIDVSKLDLVGIFNFLETYRTDDGLLLGGLKLNKVFTEVIDGTEENILEYFYVGTGAERYDTSVTNSDGTMYTAYRMDLADEYKGDLLTMLLSVVLEVFLYDENEAAVTAIIQNFKPDFTEDNFHAIKLLLTTGIQTDVMMDNINWVYFWNYDEDDLQAEIEAVLSAELNDLPEEPLSRTVNALKYSNLWNEDLRDYLNVNLESIVDLAIQMATENSDTPCADLSELLETKLNLWSDDTANTLLGYVQRLFTNVDDVLVDTIGTLLGAGQLSALKNAEARGIDTKEKFVDFFVETLSPLSNVLDFVLFGKNFEFFTQLEDGHPYTITLKGGEGYKYGLAPILAALGVDTDISDDSTEVALREVLTNLVNRIDDVLYGGNTINEALELILNVIYFIDADGLNVSISNLLAPINELLKEVNAELNISEDLSIYSMLNIPSLDFDFIFDLVANRTGINVADPIGSYIKEFYFGKTEYFTSYDNLGNFRMVYTEEENRIDMVTILITLLLDVVIYEGNNDALVALVQDLMDTDAVTAQEYVTAIVALLTNNEVSVPMKAYEWAFVKDYGDTGIVISAANGLTGESVFANSPLYGDLYTRAMGQYISKFLPLCIDTYIVLLGVDNGHGGTYRSLEDIIDQLIGTLYTNKNLQAIADAITGAVAGLKDKIGAELFNHIVEVLNISLGVDLNDILYGRVATITEGSQEEFIQAICDLVAPAAPILRWLLSSNYDLALFNHDTVVNPDDTYEAGDDYLVLNGADGYQNAIIPILEALCVGENSNIKTQAEFDAITDNSELIKTILVPIFNRLDTILDNPMEEIFKELPAVVYFLNSNGLDTAVKNLLNAVYSLLYTIEPLIADVDALHNANGEIDLLGLAGIDLSEMNANSLINLLITSISDSISGFDLTDAIGDAIPELTLGTVDSFTSVRMQPEYLKGTYENGVDNYDAAGNAVDYTMHYSADGAGGDQVDYVSIILRLLLKFISVPQNVTTIEAMLKGKLNDEGYKFVCSLLENFSQMASTQDGMQKVMYTFYYIFYAAVNAGVATNNGLAEFNGNYSFLNQLFATSNVSFLRQLEISLGDLLNKYTPEIIDDDEVIPQGQISFWQKIINFFKKIGDFFKKLFGG